MPYSAAPMATPCSSGLSPHSDWIFCSAPEITTVSKPNRNPARAEVMDQRKRRLCMRCFYPKRPPDATRRLPEPTQGCFAGSFGLCVSSQRRPSRSRKKSIHT